MNRKIIGILVCILMITVTVTPVVGLNSKNNVLAIGEIIDESIYKNNEANVAIKLEDDPLDLQSGAMKKDVQTDNPNTYTTEDNNVVIRIAQYPRISNSESSIELLFNYSWRSGDKVYRFTSTPLTLEEVMGDGEQPLNTDNFDLLVVGANYWSFLRDGIRPKVAQNIKDFLSQGGGYLGSCAGATFVSQGYENPKNFYERLTNRGVLGIVNVYINNDLDGEIQYCKRAIEGLPPIDLGIEKDNGIPIFTQYPEDTINLTFGGSPGFYYANITDNPNLGEVTPLLIYNEELMETYTLHHYQKRIFGWKKGDPIQTDLLGYFAGITSTYNDSGRIVVFGPHAEITLLVGAKVEEDIEPRHHYSSFGILPLPVYRLVNGEYINISHNWWIHRRAAAWIAGVPDDELPPCNELHVYFEKPLFRNGTQFYFKDSLVGKFFDFSLLDPPFDFPRIEKSWLLSRTFGKFVSKRLSKIVSREGMTIIVGDITVEAHAENGKIVEFYLDGELKNTSSTCDSNGIFKWKLDENNLNGVHRLEIRAYDEYGNYACEGSDFLFYNYL